MKIIYITGLFLFFLSKSYAASLCDDNEKIIYSCSLTNKKLVSICKSKDDIYYKYGQFDNIEMVYPNTLSNNIKYQSQVMASGEETRFTFSNGVYDYYVYDYFYILKKKGKTYSVPENYGIMVLANNKKIFSEHCLSKPIFEIKAEDVMPKNDFDFSLSLLELNSMN